MRRLILSCLLLVSPGFAWADVSGLWVGYYAYAAGTHTPSVECAMVLKQIGNKVAGAMVEPQTFGDGLNPGLPSDLFGILDGDRLEMQKAYVYQGDDYVAVQYSLSISPDGNIMTGFWSLGDAQGTLSFRRVTAASADNIPAPH